MSPYNNITGAVCTKAKSSALQQTGHSATFESILVVALEAAVNPVSVNCVISKIEAKGVSVTVRAVPNNREAVVANARNVSSQFGNSDSLTIAPNILERMVNDNDVRIYYFDAIRQWQKDARELLNKIPIHGGRVTNVTMTIHPDGTVTYVIFGQAPHEIDGEDEIYTQRADSYSQQTYIMAEYPATVSNKVEFDQIIASKMGSMISSDIVVKIFQTSNK